MAFFVLCAVFECDRLAILQIHKRRSGRSFRSLRRDVPDYAILRIENARGSIDGVRMEIPKGVSSRFPRSATVDVPKAR